MCQFQLQDNYFLQQNKHFLATESILFIVCIVDFDFLHILVQ